MKMKSIIFGFFILVGFSAWSQTFEEIIDQKINADELDLNNLQPFLDNMHTFVGHGLDSNDLDIFLQGPVTGTLLVSSHNESDTLTYRHLYDLFLKLKDFPEYNELKRMNVVTKELIRRPADYSNWETDKITFQELYFEEEDLENLRAYVEKHSDPSLTYETILVGFRKEYPSREEIIEKKRDGEARHLFESAENFDEQKLLQKSKEDGKPILLYFTGYNCVNCRRFEQNILIEYEVSMMLQEDFIFTMLYTDERTELPKEEQVFKTSNGRKKQLITIGDKHIQYQISRFSISSQPYFVILNSDNEVLETTSYETSHTVKDFLKVLDKGLQKY